MKLYLCSDIHNDFHKAFPKEPVDAILCAGDITNYGKTEEYREAGAWLTRISKLAPVAYIPGNHDLGLGSVQLNARSRNVLEEMQDLKGLSIYGASLSVCYAAPKLATIWDNMTCNQQAEKAYYEDIPPCDILLSHSPPSGVTGTDKEWGDIGSAELRKWIVRSQPRLVVCGHVHEPIAREEFIGRTRVLNVARRPMVVDL
jgi:uncharacterized protein